MLPAAAVPRRGRATLADVYAFVIQAKTVRAEGVAGLYRRFWAHYVRVGPHYVITFVILEKLKRLAGGH